MVGGPDSFCRWALCGHATRRRAPGGARTGSGREGLRSRVRSFLPTPKWRALRRCSRRCASFIGDDLPEMSGANRVGDARPVRSSCGRTPRLKTPLGAPMPLLALGEKGDGRAIALGRRWYVPACLQHVAVRDRGARARRALGRPARVAHARSALRASCKSSSSSPCMAGVSALASRAPARRERRGSQRRDGAPRAARSRRSQAGRVPDAAPNLEPSTWQARAGWLQRAGLGRDRSLDAPRLRVRTRGRRVGRFAPRRGASSRRSPSATGGEFLRASDAGRFRFLRPPRLPPSAVSSRCCPRGPGPCSPPPLWGFTGLPAAKRGSPSESRRLRESPLCERDASIRSLAAICR